MVGEALRETEGSWRYGGVLVSRMSSAWRRASILDGARTDRVTIFSEGTENLV